MSRADDDSDLWDSEPSSPLTPTDDDDDSDVEYGLTDIWDSEPPSPLTPTDDDDDDDDDDDEEEHIDSVNHSEWNDVNFLTLAENAGWLFYGRLSKRIDKLPHYKQEYARLLFHLRETYGEVEYKSLWKSLDGMGTWLKGFELSYSWIEGCAANYQLERSIIDGLIANRQYSLDLKLHITESNVVRGFNLRELRSHFPNMSHRDLWAGAIFRVNFLAHHFLAKEEDRFPECDYDEVVRKLYDGILAIFETKEYLPDHELLGKGEARDWRLRLLDYIGLHY